jgi:hypothetical protein
VAVWAGIKKERIYMKVYQIIVDGSAGLGWYEADPNKYRDKIKCNHAMEYGNDIRKSILDSYINSISFLQVGDVLEIEKNLRFICRDMEKAEYLLTKSWDG